MNIEQFIEQEFRSPNELVDRAIKTRTLNTIMEVLKDLEGRTENSPVLNTIGTLKLLVNDAYKVDMYKFAFKDFTKSIQEDIKQIEELL